jgi:hypothetical protein
MENLMFENMSRMEICRRMSVHCQKSADETPAGDDREAMQRASDKFKDEADQLAMDDLLAAMTLPARPRRA